MTCESTVPCELLCARFELLPCLFVLKKQTFIDLSVKVALSLVKLQHGSSHRNYSVYTVPKQCRHAPSDPAQDEAIGPQKGA